MNLKRLPSTSTAKFLLKLAAAFALLFAFFMIFEHTRGKRAYQTLLEEMRANGEETDVHKLAPEMPDESENMAADLKKLLESLSKLEDSPRRFHSQHGLRSTGRRSTVMADGLLGTIHQHRRRRRLSGLQGCQSHLDKCD